MTNALILTGGVGHAFDEAAPVLASLLAHDGITAHLSFDIEAALQGLNGTDLLVVYALRWSMTQHEKYAPLRDEWAFSLSPAGQAAIDSYVAGGGALLALHTAVICFDEWEGWAEILGGCWVWGQSHHPPVGRVDVAASAKPDHPVTRGIPSFHQTDELYSDLSMNDGNTVLLTATADGVTTPQPVLWTRQHGKGRVVVDLLGHDTAALLATPHDRLLRRAALWALNSSDTHLEAI